MKLLAGFVFLSGIGFLAFADDTARISKPKSKMILKTEYNCYYDTGEEQTVCSELSHEEACQKKDAHSFPPKKKINQFKNEMNNQDRATCWDPATAARIPVPDGISKAEFCDKLNNEHQTRNSKTQKRKIWNHNQLENEVALGCPDPETGDSIPVPQGVSRAEFCKSLAGKKK